MRKNVIETLMGAVVLIVAAGFLMFAYKGSQMRVENGYTVKAKFDNASGLTLGSDVRVGGIKVGVISDMGLDNETYQAIISMNIRADTKLPKDTTAAVVGDGLLGSKFVALVPGGDEQMLASGNTIQFTQSSVNLEELIGKFMFSGGGVDKKKDSKEPATATP